MLDEEDDWHEDIDRGIEWGLPMDRGEARDDECEEDKGNSADRMPVCCCWSHIILLPEQTVAALLASVLRQLVD